MGAKGMKVDLLPSAIMGIVDIVASTEVTNELDLFSAYELQRDFHAAAFKRAQANRVRIINSTGDGFLFVVDEKEHWQDNLMGFVQGVLSDFQQTLQRIERAQGRRLASGLRFGVARGSVILSATRAVGPAINLAARLCARAGANELVISQNVWEAAPAPFDAEITAKRTYTDLKGFTNSVNAVHAQVRAA